MRKLLFGIALISSASLAAEQEPEELTFEPQAHTVGPLNCVQVTSQDPSQHSKVSCPESYSVLSGGCIHTTGGTDFPFATEDLLRSTIDVTKNGWVCSSSHRARRYVARALCCR
jgi:hypothetical protein